MSGHSSSKKRKTLTSDSLKSMNLKEIVDAIKAPLTIYDNKEEWLEAAEKSKDGKGVYDIFNSDYYADALSVNTYVVPPMLRGFTITRDNLKRVISIKKDKLILKDVALGKIMFLGWAHSEGYKKVILCEYDDSNEVTALVFGKTWHLQDSAATKKDHQEVGIEAFLPKAKFYISVSPQSLAKVLNLAYVDINNAKNISVKLNQLMTNRAIDLDEMNLDTLEGLQGHLKACDKRLEVDFFETLIAANVEESSFDERVDAFASAPTSQFARTLQLKKPYGGTLIERGSLKPAAKVALGELGPDDEVLMSTTIIDTKFYDSIRSSPNEYPVYKATANLGILKDRKWEELKTVEAQPFESVMKLMSAIVASNQGKKSTSTSTAAALQDDEEDLEVVDV